MDAPFCLRIFCLLFLFIACNCMLVQNSNKEDTTDVREIKLFDNVYMKIPEENSTSKNLISFKVDANKEENSGRGKKKKMLEKFLPMFVLPFIIQSTIIPIFLGMIKFLLFKSLMVGKLALVLIILNAFKNHNSFRGRKDADIANLHYGYNGMEDYGSYFN